MRKECKPTNEELEQKIKDLKETISDLNNRNEMLRKLIENANDQITLIDTKGYLIELNNDATFEIFGWTREETLGKHYCDLGLFPDEIVKGFMVDQEYALKEMKGVPLPISEVEAFRKDGSKVWVELNSKVISKEGEAVGIVNIIRDITNRKRAEKALRESEEMARALLNATTDAVLLIDRHGIIIDLNEAYAQQFKKPIIEIVGLCLWDIVPEPILDTKAIVQQVFRTGRSIRFEQEYKGTWRDHIIYPILDSEKKVSRLAIFGHDITKLKHTEEALRRHRDNLETLVAKRTLNLQEANTALKVLLKRLEEDKADLEKRMLSNVKEIVLPFILELTNSHLNERQQSITEIIETNLKTITSPLVKELSSRYLSLTPVEIRVANIIKQGKTTKEVADVLRMSIRTVDNHRYNIRKKLGINNKNINLATYLMSLK